MNEQGDRRPADAEALLEAERPVPALVGDVAERILGRVLLSVAPLGGGGTTAGGQGSGHGAAAAAAARTATRVRTLAS